MCLLTTSLQTHHVDSTWIPRGVFLGMHEACYKSVTFNGSFKEENIFRKRFRISKKLIETFGKGKIMKQIKYKASKNLAF